MFMVPASVFILTIAAYLAAKKIFPCLGLLDFPERYGLSRARIPYPAGVVAVTIFLAYFVRTSGGSLQEWGLVVGVTLLAIVSFIDDRKPLPPIMRLLVQVVVVFIIVAAGSRIYTLTNPIGGFLKLDTSVLTVPLFGRLPLLSLLVTMGWLLLTINAMNWFDGISGQVGSVSSIGFLMIGLLAQYRNDQPELALLAYVLFGIAAAGVFFDFPPAKMLLGDTGAMFFGLLLGVLGVYQGGKVATAFLAIGLPLLDATFVVIARILRGSSPLRGGRDHLHHRLLALGWSERSVVLFMAIIGSMFGITALFLSTLGKFIAALLLLVLMLGIHVAVRRREATLSARGRAERSTS